jgi:hypothetical protein
MNGGQYNDVLANNTYFGGYCEKAIYMTFGWWSLWLICLKQNFILSFSNQNFLIIEDF